MDDLDRTSEAIERQALLSLHQHCPAETRQQLDLFLEEVDDALVCGAGNDSSILLNRTLGMGTTTTPVRPHTVEQIGRIYAHHDVERYFVHVYPHTLTDGSTALEAAGLKKARGWMKFNRDDSPALARATELEVRCVNERDSADFGRIVALAFGLTKAAGSLLAALARDPRWHLFVSYEGEHAVGAGSLFVDDGVAWFEWGATDPAFRRRGSQGAIMTARINKARELGCTAMFTETGEAVAGDPQHSYGNIQRFGFTESILRENWAPT